MRRFTRHDILEGLSESTYRPKNCKFFVPSYAFWSSRDACLAFAFYNTSESTAKMVHMGLKAHIGAHGEPPLGLNYHAEMFFTRVGGLSNYEVSFLLHLAEVDVERSSAPRSFVQLLPTPPKRLVYSTPWVR